MSIPTSNPTSPIQAPDDAPLVLRLRTPIETEVTQQLLAQRPRLAEASDTEPQHPSRVYIQFGGSELFGAIRVHLQVHRALPRLVLEHPESSATQPQWYGLVGNHHRVTSPHFLYPDPTHAITGFVYLGSRPILGLKAQGGFRQGIDMQLVRYRDCPSTKLTLFPLQVGREFKVPSPSQASCFEIATDDLPVYTDLDE